MAWSFDSLTFEWLRQDENSVGVDPAWRRKPRLVVRPLLGLGDADIARVGYEPWTISGPIYVAAAQASALIARDGTSATLTDGTTSWTATAEISLVPVTAGGGTYTGTATFTRGRA